MTGNPACVITSIISFNTHGSSFYCLCFPPREKESDFLLTARQLLRLAGSSRDPGTSFPWMHMVCADQSSETTGCQSWQDGYSPWQKQSRSQGISGWMWTQRKWVPRFCRAQEMRGLCCLGNGQPGSAAEHSHPGANGSKRAMLSGLRF